MTHILDRFISTTSVFRPKTPVEFFALRLAHKLDDTAAAAHYAELAGQYSECDLLMAFRHAICSRNYNRGRRFHVELRHHGGNGGNGRNATEAAIRVERRAIAVAIFTGEHLSYTQVRQLSSVRDRALASAAGFINWITEQFQPDSATLESIPIEDEIHRKALNNEVIRVLRDRMLPIGEVPKQDLFQAFGYPPLKFRKELRHVIADIWPVLAGSNGQSFVQDAAALGLYAQTERLFILN